MRIRFVVCFLFEIIGADIFIGKPAFPAWIQGKSILLVPWNRKKKKEKKEEKTLVRPEGEF